MGFVVGFLLGRDSNRPQGQRSGCLSALVVFVALALMIPFVAEAPYVAVPILVVVFGLGAWAKAREPAQGP